MYIIRSYQDFISESERHPNIKQHLIERGVKDFKGITLSQEEGVAYFWLYNLNGQIIGYQRYNPLGLKNYTPKGESDKQNQKYWTFFSDDKFERKVKAAFWGWQFYNPNKQDVFLVEGVFDAVKVVNAGQNVFATLGNDPVVLKQQIWLLKAKHRIIVIADDDDAGKRLMKYGDIAIQTSGGKDLGDLSQSAANRIIFDLIKR